MNDNPEKRDDSNPDEYSLSHDQLAQSALFDFVDVMESRDAGGRTTRSGTSATA